MLEISGFNFTFDEKKCLECGGKCCIGERGYIFVTPNEIKQIVEFMNMDFESFCLRFIKKVGYRYSLIEKKMQNGMGYACVFFDEKTKQCKIYQKRPSQCVRFPFWKDYEEDFKDLLKECIGVVKK